MIYIETLVSQEFKNRDDSQWNDVCCHGNCGWLYLSGKTLVHQFGAPVLQNEGIPQDSSGCMVVQDAPGQLMSDNPVNQNEQKTFRKQHKYSLSIVQEFIV